MSLSEKFKDKLDEAYPGMGQNRETSAPAQGSSQHPSVQELPKGAGATSVAKAGSATKLAPNAGPGDKKPHPQGSSDENPDKDEIDTDNPTSSAKGIKQAPVPKNHGAGKAPNYTTIVDPASVVNQSSSKGNVHQEDVDHEDEEYISEEDFLALSPEEQAEYEEIVFEDELDEDTDLTEEELDAMLSELSDEELEELAAELDEETEELEEGNAENKAKKNDHYDKKGASDSGGWKDRGSARRADRPHKSVEDKIKDKVDEKGSDLAKFKRSLIRGKGMLGKLSDKSVKTITGLRKESIQFDAAVLFEGDTTLTEEFKTKAAALFEAVVTAKVTELREQLEEEAVALATEAFSEQMDNLVEAMDLYLTEAATEWVAQNELAIETGVRANIAESLLSNLHTLFTEHYITVPESKIDVVDALDAELQEATATIEALQADRLEMDRLITSMIREQVIEEVGSSLASTQRDKLRSLTEDIAFDNTESFTERVIAVRDSMFGSSKTLKSDEALSEEHNPIAELAKRMPIDPSLAYRTAK